MRMGGAHERIDLKLIAHPDKELAEAWGLLKEQFQQFDAAKAQCFMQADRQRLLAVVEAGFGDFKEFNNGVRSTFMERLRVGNLRELRNIFKSGSSGEPALQTVVRQATSEASGREVEVARKAEMLAGGKGEEEAV